jgi:ubiquinone/menaquinone biosynthesis C-methylase UbiE
MRWMDYALQQWRSKMAEKHIRPGDVLLDVGCYDGLFLARVQSRVTRSVGVDKFLPDTLVPQVQCQLLVSDVNQGLPFPSSYFDVVSLLAVFEHLQNNIFVVTELGRVLRPDGRVILTVPGDQVDRVLDWLVKLGVADGMSLEEHHGYQAKDTPALFERQGFTLHTWQRFQWGLNNLFVFQKL